MGTSKQKGQKAAGNTAKRNQANGNSVIIRHQTERWASCDVHGNLCFNWRIIQAPMRLVDYVVHQLAHLRHKDHTKAYWALLGKIMPDYDKQLLGQVGADLTWGTSE